MRDNVRQRRRRFELALTARQVGVLLVAALAMLGVAFVLGVSVGRQAAAAAPAEPVATRTSLDRLDAPIPARDEPAPELKAPQALTDARPIEKAMPLAPAKLVQPSPPAATSGPAAAGSGAATKAATAQPAASVKPPAPERKAGYAIQVASSPRRADAERIATRLAGHNPRIVTAEVPGKGRHYRVQVGPFATQEAARAQLPQLARAGLHGIVVTARR